MWEINKVLADFSHKFFVLICFIIIVVLLFVKCSQSSPLDLVRDNKHWLKNRFHLSISVPACVQVKGEVWTGEDAYLRLWTS